MVAAIGALSRRDAVRWWIIRASIANIFVAVAKLYPKRGLQRPNYPGVVAIVAFELHGLRKHLPHSLERARAYRVAGYITCCSRQDLNQIHPEYMGVHTNVNRTPRHECTLPM